MKKPQSVKAQYIPRNKANSAQQATSPNESSKIDVREMLGKLDGEQITNLGNGVIELASNGMELAKEVLKTGQVLAQTQAEILKSGHEVKKIAIQEETKQKEIKLKEKANESNSCFETRKEANNHEQIMKILEHIENGKVSSEQLSELIFAIKSGS